MLCSTCAGNVRPDLWKVHAGLPTLGGTAVAVGADGRAATAEATGTAAEACSQPTQHYSLRDSVWSNPTIPAELLTAISITANTHTRQAHTSTHKDTRSSTGVLVGAGVVMNPRAGGDTPATPAATDAYTY